MWPADDLVTMRPQADLVLDRLLAGLRGNRPSIAIGQNESLSSIAVLGFPRSANTLLTTWLTTVVKPGVTVLDGRFSHSSLDLHRVTDAGIPVVVPVRAPVDACASMMVRKDLQDSASYGREILRSYAAWHRLARGALDCACITVAMFADITTDPASIVRDTALAELVDLEVVARMDMEALVERTRSSLAGVIGQGLPEDGIAAHQMISLPEPARAPELQRARAILGSPGLRRVREDSERAYEDFISAAELAQPVRFVERHSRNDAARGSETTR